MFKNCLFFGLHHLSQGRHKTEPCIKQTYLLMIHCGAIMGPSTSFLLIFVFKYTSTSHKLVVWACQVVGLQGCSVPWKQLSFECQNRCIFVPKTEMVRLFVRTTIILLSFFNQIVITLCLFFYFESVDIKRSYCEDEDHCVQLMISVLPKKEKQLEMHLVVTWFCLKTHFWQFSGIQSINLNDYRSCHHLFSRETCFPGNIYIALLQYQIIVKIVLGLLESIYTQSNRIITYRVNI